MIADTTPHVRNILDRLKGVKKSGKGWTACCPVHENDNGKHRPSLSIGTGEGGRVLLHCHAGCPLSGILHAIDLTEADLFPPKSGSSPARRRQSRSKLVSEILPAALTDLDAATAAPAVKIETTYDYRTASGGLLYQVVRYAPKTFRQRRPDGNGGWIHNLVGVKRVLYRLPELSGADKGAWVFIVEGEKDADNLADLKLLATCNSGGAGKWKTLADDSALHGRCVAIIPDRDSAGEKHAQDVASRLHGKAAAVRIIDLGKIEGFKKKDISDWIAWLDCRDDVELHDALLAMAEAAPLWQPTVEPMETGDADDFVAVVRTLSNVKPKPVTWLWPGRIPAGKVSLLIGHPGQGKSLLTLDIAARVSTGAGWPDNSESFEPANVILLSGEDDVDDTIAPRLWAAKADVDRISILPGVNYRDPDTGATKFELPALDRHIEAIAAAVRKAAAKLLIIDPISSFVGRVDDHRNAELRNLLTALAAMGRDTGCAVLCVSHLRKSGGLAVHQAVGSLAYTAAARAVWCLVRDPDNRERRLLLPVKMNLARDVSGLAFALTSDDEVNAVPYLCWESEPIEQTADDILNPPDRRPGPPPVEREEACEWLSIALADGPREANELFTEARANGISRATLTRAKSELGIQVGKKGFQGPWTWSMPASVKESPKVLTPPYTG